MAAGIVLEKIKRESKPIQARLSFWHAKYAKWALSPVGIHGMAVNAAVPA